MEQIGIDLLAEESLGTDRPCNLDTDSASRRLGFDSVEFFALHWCDRRLKHAAPFDMESNSVACCCRHVGGLRKTVAVAADE